MEALDKFPPEWIQFFDEALPNWVKSTYSPKESWKGKPFDKPDASFFSKGIAELSETFTSSRSTGVKGKQHSYFGHPRFRSAYLLYFFPLQAAKFFHLLRSEPGAIESALTHAREHGTLRVLDLGAGPGTASFAFLFALWDFCRRHRLEIPSITLEWIDDQEKILGDGEKLLEVLVREIPAFAGKITLFTRITSVQRYIPKAPSSIALLGNVLNEFKKDEWDRLKPIASHAAGAGMLFLEPASRQTSHQLVSLRSWLLTEELIPQPAFWGPCLHAGVCPLAHNKDWCHSSVPLQVPGRWFMYFSKKLGSARLWLKFSYLWAASRANPAPAHQPGFHRVLSEPLNTRGEDAIVLLCAPEQVRRATLPRSALSYRGGLVRLQKNSAGPLSEANRKGRLRRSEF